MSEVQFKYLSFGLFASLVVLSHSVQADDDFFADIEFELEEENVESDYLISGRLEQGVSYGIQAPSTSGFDRQKEAVESLDSSLYLALEKDVLDDITLKVAFDLSLDWAKWQDDSLSYNAQDADFEWRDLYMDVVEDDLWLRAGNQILAWGESDALTITDVVNPRDMTRLGQADLEDIRLQVPALFLSHPWSGMQLEAALIYDGGTNQYADSGAAFDPFISYYNSGINIRETEPENELEWVGRAYKRFGGGDFAITLADVNWDEMSATEFTNGNSLTFQSSRVTLFGVSGSWVKGNYLFKYDVAQHWNKALQPENVSQAPWQEYDQTLAAGVVEYSGIDEWVFTLELDASYTHDYTSRLATKAHQYGYFARARWTTWNEQLTTQFSLLNLLGGEGRIYRLTSDYDIQDAMTLGSEYVVYSVDSESDDLYAYRNQDVVKLRYSYHF